MNNNEIIKEVKKVIRKLRPYLNQDGGDLEFVLFTLNYLEHVWAVRVAMIQLKIVLKLCY